MPFARQPTNANRIWTVGPALVAVPRSAGPGLRAGRLNNRNLVGAQFGWLTALFLGVTLLTGCTNYQLGTGVKTRFSTLFIAPVASSTLIPQAQVLVTTQLREAFIKDGRVTLVDSPEAADAVLRITLSGYDRTVAVSRADDTGLARRFDLSLRAQATLTDNRTKADYFAKRPLAATRGVFTDSGLVPSEYQTLPLLAEQLANETVHAVLDVW